ncbi:ABC transporter ATP-binding protein [Rhizobium sp. DKSPLA3]|uniref:ABC transporter ATP-binding protein n=1 Tax=Rhizobium quercicola TaxID=2901226 RepID=A0A9X1NMW4_9HYPH|nr:ABC transporter ATP-binding protein [Rhizobium quercicola]
MPETRLEIDNISVSYGANRILDGIDLRIAKGEFVALLGSSGCGKTTLLRTIAGFAQPDAGAIRVGSRDVTTLPPDKRGMALVFQSYALWPHMTVAQNIGYGLKLRRRSPADIARVVSEMERLLGLTGLSARKPAELSGGQRQRVALGRALAIDPEILLLDEPMSNLDARIRLQVRHEIRTLQQKLGITTVHVTHDREEAMVMADRIVILNGGRIAQAGRPEAVYNRPETAFVAAFMGAENQLILPGGTDGETIAIAAGASNAACSVPRDGRLLTSGHLEARFRPEAATLEARSPAGVRHGEGLVLAGDIVDVSYPGGLWRHTVRVGGAMIQVDAPHACAPGTAVYVTIAPDKLFLFAAPPGTLPAPLPHPAAAPNEARVLEASPH